MGLAYRLSVMGLVARVHSSVSIAFATAACATGEVNAPVQDEGPDTTVASVSVAPAMVTLVAGDTVRLTATVRNAGGEVLSGRSIIWSSSMPSVATVSDGLVTAVTQGNATITAAAGARSGTASATVSSTPPGGNRTCENPDPEWIWCDDFESDRLADYFEYDDAGGRFVRTAAAGRDGSFGMRARFLQGQTAAGSLHLAMGRTPQTYFRPVDSGTADYRDVYWRVYVRNEPGWTGGGGDKLSRAFIFASSTTWAQAMLAHVWSGGGAEADYLGIDPASGTDILGNVLTTQYNDFGNFRWLGWKRGVTTLFSSGRIGQWHCVEAHAALNDAGETNGVFELWVDDTLEAASYNLNWVGSYSEYGINAVYFENFWNAGSPQDQERYFDDIVVSTQRIFC